MYLGENLNKDINRNIKLLFTEASKANGEWESCSRMRDITERLIGGEEDV